MASSGLTTFNLDITEIIEHAFRMAGKEAKTGGDFSDARRALDLLLIDWGNKGLNLWTVKSGTVSLVEGTVSYSLATDCIDVIEAVVRSETGEQTQNDRPLRRISYADYMLIPNKLMQNTPSRFAVDRQISPMLYLHAAPNEAGTVAYWYIRKIERVGASGAYNADTPVRFLPAMTAGLAYHVAMFDIDYDLNRLNMLKSDYMEKFADAGGEDRDRASFRIRPARR